MVGDDIGHALEPELGDLVEDDPFVGDRLVHDDIERRDAVGGDDQQVFAQVVDIADLAAVDELEVGKIGLLDECGHGCPRSAVM